MPANVLDTAVSFLKLQKSLEEVGKKNHLEACPKWSRKIGRENKNKNKNIFSHPRVPQHSAMGLRFPSVKPVIPSLEGSKREEGCRPIKKVIAKSVNGLANAINRGSGENSRRDNVLTNDLIAAFNKYFEVITADTPLLLEETFHLRYQIYCQEKQALNPSQGEFETDEFDCRSIHNLIRHNSSGTYMGSVRMILAEPGDQASPFPFETYLSQKSYAAFPGLASLPRGRIAELSRFLISARFRSRRREGGSTRPNNPPSIPPQKERRIFPHPVLGLFVAIVRMAAVYGVTHWYAFMSPSLHRLLRQFGIRFQPIGPVVEYYGPRCPYLGVVPEVMDGIYHFRRDIWDLLTDRGRFWSAPQAPQQAKELAVLNYPIPQPA